MRCTEEFWRRTAWIAFTKEKTLPKPKDLKALQAPCWYTHNPPPPQLSANTSLQAALVAWEPDLAKEQAGNISLSVSRAIQL